MTCRLSGLFSIGEDFDDEDSDWLVGSVCGSSAALSSDGGQTVAPGLRKLSAPIQPPPPQPPPPQPPPLSLPPPQLGGAISECLQDEFDDWDVDLSDLEECDQLPPAPPTEPPHPRQPPTTEPPPLRSCGGVQRGSGGLRELNTTNHSLPPPAPPPHRLTGPRTPQPPPTKTQRPWSTPAPPPQSRVLFDTLSSPSAPPPLSPPPLHTPVLTNRLVQLVSASSRPNKRPRAEPPRPRERRFPGPAGALPQQLQGQSLDSIVVSAPVTPAHGAVARSIDQACSSQEFSGAAWTAMKEETGVDDKNPTSFLHTHSIIMVLRKAALRQLVRNKVPNMAVLLHSITHTHTDARAVFTDPTGEIQGTLHRRLLEQRAEELQVGAVLLLKQVGVFSPSHRNHYLNVTPTNLLRVYSPDGVCTLTPPLLTEAMLPLPRRPHPVSQMQLVFDEEEEEGPEEGKPNQQTPTDTKTSSTAPQEPGWDEDDDLDEFLGQLPEDTYSM